MAAGALPSRLAVRWPWQAQWCASRFVLIAIVTGILFIMQGFLSHTFGIEIF